MAAAAAADPNALVRQGMSKFRKVRFGYCLPFATARIGWSVCCLLL